jgi:Electron transfer flavoprotein, alpha subunit
MANIFAFAEARNGELRKVALENVTAARKLADATGGQVYALLVGAPGIAAKAAQLAEYGADVVLVCEHAGFTQYNPEATAALAADRIRSGGFRAAVFSTSAQGRDLAPRVAAKLRVGLVTRCDIRGAFGRQAHSHASAQHWKSHRDGHDRGDAGDCIAAAEYLHAECQRQSWNGRKRGAGR